jgi:hypothetical protein
MMQMVVVLAVVLMDCLVSMILTFKHWDGVPTKIIDSGCLRKTLVEDFILRKILYSTFCC